VLSCRTQFLEPHFSSEIYLLRSSRLHCPSRVLISGLSSETVGALSIPVLSCRTQFLEPHLSSEIYLLRSSRLHCPVPPGRLGVVVSPIPVGKFTSHPSPSSRSPAPMTPAMMTTITDTCPKLEPKPGTPIVYGCDPGERIEKQSRQRHKNRDLSRPHFTSVFCGNVTTCHAARVGKIHPRNTIPHIPFIFPCPSRVQQDQCPQ
jgi:hypothetical protein